MVKNHIKRISAPKRWDILRKDNKFISRPNAGRDFSLAIALNTALKEMIGKTKTTKESKFLIRYKSVLVNGIRRYDEKYPVGFLDVVSFPELKEHYRLLVNEKNKLIMIKIPESEASLKISKVSGRNILRKGVVQLNCTDGRNFIINGKVSFAADVKTNDTLVYEIPGQAVREVLKMEKGSIVYLYQGKHIGNVVKVEDFIERNILFKLNGEPVQTKKQYAFVVGKDKPIITVTESNKEKEGKTSN